MDTRRKDIAGRSQKRVFSPSAKVRHEIFSSHHGFVPNEFHIMDALLAPPSTSTIFLLFSGSNPPAFGIGRTQSKSPAELVNFVNLRGVGRHKEGAFRSQGTHQVTCHPVPRTLNPGRWAVSRQLSVVLCHFCVDSRLLLVASRRFCMLSRQLYIEDRQLLASAGRGPWAVPFGTALDSRTTASQ